MKNHESRIVWALALVLGLLLCCGMALGEQESAVQGPENLYLYYEYAQAYSGQSQKPDVTFEPASAVTALEWSVSDPAVAEVDPADGTLIALQAGTAKITATAANGLQANFTLTVYAPDPGLVFEAFEDGSGCRITGCEAQPRTVYTVNIPAEWNGLPVKEIAGEAFKDCENLRAFTVDEDQATFYALDGILYTDDPVKTLVRFPNNRAFPCGLYEVPADTKAIGPCAFAGLRGLEKLYLPEGLTDMGDRAFMEVWTQVFVYVPDSLVNIGDNLFLNQMSNVPFYGHWESAIGEYAMNNAIPFAGVFDYEVPPQTVEPIRMERADNDPEPFGIPEGPAWDYAFTDWVDYDLGGLLRADLTEMQESTPGMIRLDVGGAMNKYLPNAAGYSVYPAMEGVYGVGHTEQETLLIGYDREGRMVGKQKVDGDFSFGLKDATQLCVIGGKGTHMSLSGFEPMVIPSPGELPLDQNPGVLQPDGSLIQYYAVTFPEVNLSWHFPDYLNIFRYQIYYADGSAEPAPYYALLAFKIHDPLKLDKLNQISMNFDRMVTLAEYDDFVCEAKASYHLDAAYGERMYEIWQAVKQAMIGTHYPEDGPVHPVKISVNGQYPTSFMCEINLDDLCLDFSESNVLAYAHEMTHALDQSITNYTDSLAQQLPSAWMEGRAEVISRQALDLLGVEYEPFYGENMSWDFLSQEEKENFAHFWFFSSNSETSYTVGYNFYRYLLERFGDTVGATVIKKISEVSNAYIDEAACRMISDIIREATCETVFEDFVRDVVEKE